MKLLSRILCVLNIHSPDTHSIDQVSPGNRYFPITFTGQTKQFTWFPCKRCGVVITRYVAESRLLIDPESGSSTGSRSLPAR